MKYQSTRNTTDKVSFETALFQGLAPDGGLYLPESIPQKLISKSNDFTETATEQLSDFIDWPNLSEICQKAFHFPIRIHELSEQLKVLELFHGPTGAFKDFGARFLAQCMGQKQTKTKILVATSGDTGGAVASAYENVPGTEVYVLFPADGISPFQKHQLTCWSDNIHSIAVKGTFDDCQKMVKRAMSDLSDENLSSANSINIGRLLPQMTYFTWAALQLPNHHWVIPTGNMGHAVAAMMSWKTGSPFHSVEIATNANPTLSEFFSTGEYHPRASVATLANAMDVGAPSNMERFLHLFPDSSQGVTATRVDNDQIIAAIRDCHTRYGYTLCPHTATAYHTAQKSAQPTVIVGTAHPAKFSEVVDLAIGREPDMPANLKAILSRHSRFETIRTYEELVDIVRS